MYICIYVYIHIYVYVYTGQTACSRRSGLDPSKPPTASPTSTREFPKRETSLLTTIGPNPLHRWDDLAGRPWEVEFPFQCSLTSSTYDDRRVCGRVIAPQKRDWYFAAGQPAPAPHLAHPERCASGWAALRTVLVTVHRVSRSESISFSLSRSKGS